MNDSILKISKSFIMKELFSNEKRIIILTFFFSAILFITGCASSKPALYERSLTGLDFSKYSRDGFLVTPGDAFKEYTSLSILRAVCYDGYILKETPDNKKSDIWKGEDANYGELPSSSNMKDYEYKGCKLSELLDYMVEQARKNGADGIVRLEIKEVSRISPVSGENQDGILITGLAVSFMK